MQCEVHDLNPGDTFSWTDNSPRYLVTDTGLIGYEGSALVLYQAEDGLHACIRDHTQVWTYA